MGWLPGGVREPGLGPVRSVVLALVVGTAGVLAVGGAVAVVESVPPLPAPLPAAAPSPVVPAVAAPPASPAPVAEPALTLTAADALPPKTPGWPRVVVLGDTFTSGADGAAGSTWPELACGRLQCEYVARFAVPGAGFTQPGADGRTLASLADQVAATDPDLVVVAGGAWDLGVPQPVLADAVDQLLARLDLLLPDAQAVVLSPFWPSAPAPPEVDLVRTTLLDAAARHGLAFLDVSDLFDASRTALVAPDGSAPTSDGQVYLADVLTPWIGTALGR